MKFSLSTTFDRAGDYGIMKKRSHPEHICMGERITLCVR
jgi:hypothetical protein